MQHTSVAEWLASLGLAQYAPAFEENRIDFETLDGLSELDLKSSTSPPWAIAAR